MVARRKRKLGGATGTRRKKRGSKRRSCQQRAEGANRPKLLPNQSSLSNGEPPQSQLSAEGQNESLRQHHGSKPVTGSGGSTSVVVINAEGVSRIESEVNLGNKPGELNAREVAAMMTAACAKTASGVGGFANWGSMNGKHEEVKPNCIDQFMAIRTEIDKQMDNVTPLIPTAPQGFEDYLMNQRTYTLAGSESQSPSDSALTEPKSEIHPDTPTRITPQLEEILMEQIQERHRIRKQHLVEREKVVLSMEQETIREHNRAAALEQSNQTFPFSFCTILKDQEIYNTLPKQPDTSVVSTGLSECVDDNMLQSSLKELDDKWSKIKENMILRHRQEASSLVAKQKVDLELRLFDLGISINPVINKWYMDRIPLVHVNDKF